MNVPKTEYILVFKITKTAQNSDVKYFKYDENTEKCDILFHFNNKPNGRLNFTLFFLTLSKHGHCCLFENDTMPVCLNRYLCDRVNCDDYIMSSTNDYRFCQFF